MVQMLKNMSAMQEIWVHFLGQEHPLEKGMEPHSSILVWEIPCTEEPAGLQSMVASTLSIFCTILLFYVILKLQS